MDTIDNEAKRQFYKLFGESEQTVQEKVETIKNWLKTQKHLPEIMSDEKIRNMLNLCKFNTNKVKQKIDNYYTVRSKYPDLFDESNPKLERLKDVLEQTHISNFPILLDGIHRASFIKSKQPNTFDAKSVAMLCLAILEVRLQADFMVDDILIVDMENITFRDMCRITFPVVYKSFMVYKDIYSLRVHSIYTLNSPSYITILMKIMKLVLPSKIFNRFKVCQDAEALKELFPLELLPKDYGGNGPSLDELDVTTKNRLVEFGERFDLLDELRVDESLRMEKTKVDQ